MSYISDLDNSDVYADSYEMHHLKEQLNAYNNIDNNNNDNNQNSLIENYLPPPSKDETRLVDNKPDSYLGFWIIPIIVVNVISTGFSMPLYPNKSDSSNTMLRFELMAGALLIPALLEIPKLHKSMFTVVNCLNIMICGLCIIVWQVITLDFMIKGNIGHILFGSSMVFIICFIQGLFIT